MHYSTKAAPRQRLRPSNQTARKGLAMTSNTLPTPHELRKMFSYNPSTGVLMRIANGKSDWSIKDTGYMQVRLGRFNRPAHRIVWAIYYGEWPQGEIDHINGRRADNRIANLRCVSRAANMRNRKAPNTNLSGCVGVRWIAELKKWRAVIWFEGNNIHLGVFSSKNDAIRARKKAEKRFGFHPNHGR